MVDRVHHHAELLAVLADAAAVGADLRALAESLTRQFARWMPLKGVELGFAPPGGRHRVISVKPGAATTEQSSAEAEAELTGSLVAQVMSSGEIGLFESAGLPPSRREHRVAMSLDCAWLIVLPLRIADETLGFSVLYIDSEPKTKPVLDPALMTAAARIIALGLMRVSALASGASNPQAQVPPQVSVEVPALAPPAASDVYLVGTVMSRTTQKLKRVAAHDTPVLLRGETGTGKAALAQVLHRDSGRSGPLLTQNCAARAEVLVERAIFDEHTGLLARAEGGTLFVDNVEALGATGQDKLLRFLSADADDRPNVRLVAGSSADLETQVARGAMSAELFYALSVFSVELPPLRRRPMDIPELSEALLDQISARLGRPAPRLGRALVTSLSRRRWSGNVRELENVLERAMILLPEGHGVLEVDADDEPALVTSDDVMTFAEASRAAISRALRSARGQIYGEAGAAKTLGLNPSTLQSKMKKLGIRREHFVR